MDADDQRMQLALALYRPPKVRFSPSPSSSLSSSSTTSSSSTSSRWTIHFTLTLLSMEEDEAADSGFPTLLNPKGDDDYDDDGHDDDNADNEHLICTSESRFVYSYWQVARQRHIEEPSSEPISRLIPTIRSPGVVELSIHVDIPETTTAYRPPLRLDSRRHDKEDNNHDSRSSNNKENNNEPNRRMNPRPNTATATTHRRIFTITHEDTGSSLQVDLTWPDMVGGNHESASLLTTAQRLNRAGRGENDVGRDLNEDREEEEDDENPLNGEEEEDDNDEEDYHDTVNRTKSHHHRRRTNMPFVYDAMDRDEEDGDDEDMDEDEFEDDGFIVNDEEEEESHDDVCQICNEDGELMICDGGKDMEGCGRGFHALCVGRSTIPEGDWICSDCARSGGIHVDGNRGYEFVKKNKRRVVGLMALEDSSSSEDEEKGKGTNANTNPTETFVIPKKVRTTEPSSKRRRVLVDSDEEEDGNEDHHIDEEEDGYEDHDGCEEEDGNDNHHNDEEEDGYDDHHSGEEVYGYDDDHSDEEEDGYGDHGDEGDDHSEHDDYE